MPQHALRVFQGSMLLHVRPQRPAHHRTDAPPEEVLSPARNRLTFPFSPSERGKHQASGEESSESFRQASMTGRTEFN